MIPQTTNTPRMERSWPVADIILALTGNDLLTRSDNDGITKLCGGRNVLELDRGYLVACAE